MSPAGTSPQSLPFEPQDRKLGGLDVRVPAGALDDPRRARLSGAANYALICLQIIALREGRDGLVYPLEYLPGGAFRGVPYITEKLIDELVTVGLAERVNTADGLAVQVTWVGQSTAEERAHNRERNRIRQQAYRDRIRAEAERLEAPEANTGRNGNVTRYASVTNTLVTPVSREHNGNVGQDRTGTGARTEIGTRTGQDSMGVGTVVDESESFPLKAPPKDLSQAVTGDSSKKPFPWKDYDN